MVASNNIQWKIVVLKLSSQQQLLCTITIEIKCNFSSIFGVGESGGGGGAALKAAGVCAQAWKYADQRSKLWKVFIKQNRSFALSF